MTWNSQADSRSSNNPRRHCLCAWPPSRFGDAVALGSSCSPAPPGFAPGARPSAIPGGHSKKIVEHTNNVKGLHKLMPSPTCLTPSSSLPLNRRAETYLQKGEAGREPNLIKSRAPARLINLRLKNNNLMALLRGLATIPPRAAHGYFPHGVPSRQPIATSLRGQATVQLGQRKAISPKNP